MKRFVGAEAYSQRKGLPWYNKRREGRLKPKRLSNVSSGQPKVPDGLFCNGPKEGTIEAQWIMPQQGLQMGHCQFQGAENGCTICCKVLISRFLRIVRCGAAG